MLGKTREVLSLELIIYLSWGKTHLSTLPNILWVTTFSSLPGRNRYYPSPSESTACCYIQSFQVVLSPALGSLLTHRCILCRSAPDWVRKECKRDLSTVKYYSNGMTLICLAFTDVKIQREVYASLMPVLLCLSVCLFYFFSVCVLLLLSSHCSLVPTMQPGKKVIRKGVLSWPSDSCALQSILPL